MTGLLPDEVRLNRLTGLQSADLGYRILQVESEVRDVLNGLQRSELAREVVDLSRLHGVLQSLKHEVNAATSRDAGTILLRGMMAGLFLQRF